MHETDMTKALIVTLRNWWEAQPERPKISCVHLTVGQPVHWRRTREFGIGL